MSSVGVDPALPGRTSAASVTVVPSLLQSSRPVADARLQLVVHDTNAASGGEGGTLHVLANSTWSEATTTFNNVPAVNGTVLDAVKLPVVQERLAKLGVQPMPMSVEQFEKFVRDDLAATVKLARDVGIAPTN